VLRAAHDANLPLALPPSHPFKSLAALRLASITMDAAKRRRLITLLFDATWARGEDVSDAKVLERIASEAGVVLGESTTQAVKDRLRAQTEGALAAGAFGVPTMIVDGELFFGNESISHLDRFLRGEDPVDRTIVERWATLPASAKRSS
jgi:2-hydroxychromene-2-carboxylate isomerase